MSEISDISRRDESERCTRSRGGEDGGGQTRIDGWRRIPSNDAAEDLAAERPRWGSARIRAVRICRRFPTYRAGTNRSDVPAAAAVKMAAGRHGSMAGAAFHPMTRLRILRLSAPGGDQPVSGQSGYVGDFRHIAPGRIGAMYPQPRR